MKAFPKNARVGLAIEAEILVLMVGLKLAKDEGLPNLLVEGDSAIVIYWVNKERSSWQFDEWLLQNFSSNLFFFFFFFFLVYLFIFIRNNK